MPLKSSLEPQTILVLCEGNHCRSPIAQALLQQGLGEGFHVVSAGLAAPPGVPAHPQAVSLMAAHGLDISRHISRQVDPALALSADIILVMDLGQKGWCEAMTPSARGRVFLLGHWQTPPMEIADPINRDSAVFRSVLEAIQQCVAGWVPHLKQRSA